MAYDPTAACAIIGSQRYQVLKPEQTVEIVVGQEETGILDANSAPIMRDITEQRVLPPEWDEAATMALVYRDHGEPTATQPVEQKFEDIG